MSVPRTSTTRHPAGLDLVAASDRKREKLLGDILFCHRYLLEFDPALCDDQTFSSTAEISQAPALPPLRPLPGSLTPSTTEATDHKNQPSCGTVTTSNNNGTARLKSNETHGGRPQDPFAAAELFDFRVKDDMLPDSVHVRSSSSIYPALHHNIALPFDLELAYSKLNYTEQAVLLYRLGYKRSFKEIAKALHFKDTRSVKAILETALHKLAVIMLSTEDNAGEVPGKLRELSSRSTAAANRVELELAS